MTDPALGRVRWQNGCRIVRRFSLPVNFVDLDSKRSDLNLFDVATKAGSSPESANIRPYLDADVTMFADPRPGRCSDGSFGVWYAGSSLGVALDETIYHLEQYMTKVESGPRWTTYWAHMVDVDLHLYDVNGMPGMRDPDDYTSSRKAAAKLHEEGGNGVVWDSVRSHRGQCIGLFRPEIVPKTTVGLPLGCHWDGERVDLVNRFDTGEIIRSAS